MNETGLAVVGYVVWMVFLLFVFLFVRIRSLVKGKVRTTTFKPDGSDVSAFAERLSRVHANCYESGTIILTLLILALAIDQTQITDALALYLLAARVGQGVIHMLSISANMVRIRFVLFAIQIGIVLVWADKFLRLFL